MANSLNITNIPAPRVPFIDERTGLMAREWYRFFLNLFVLTGSGNNPITLEELQLGPPNQPDLAELLIQINQNIAPQYEDQSGDFLATLDTAQLMSMMARFENLEAAIQGAYLNPPSVPTDGVYVPYNNATTNVDLNNKHLVNVAHIGVGTSSTPDTLILAVGDNGSLSRIVMRGYSASTASSAMRVSKYRGTVTAPQVPQSGDSLGQFQFAGYATTSADGSAGAYWEGVTTETWGATANGTKVLLKVTPNTTTTPVTAVTIDQDKSVTFATTASATTFIGALTGIASGNVLSVSGTAPVVSSGGTTPAISMPKATTSVDGYLSSTDWTTFNSKGNGTVSSVSVVSANGLAGTVATATTTPAITLSTTITGLLKGNGTAISAATSGTDYAPATSGTSILYGNGSGGFSNVTIGTGVSFAAGTLSATGSGGTVTSVTGTAPVVSSGGATPAISMAAATTSVNGYLTSTDWNTFNGKGSGTVTSVAALTLGTTGTDLSSTVANGTTTPVITLQVPTASATNRGALSAADWTTFNSKGSGTVTSVSGTGTVNGITLTGTVTTTGSLTLGGTLSGVSLTTQVSGTLPTANGGTGITTTPSNGQIPIGNGTNYVAATLTAGAGIGVTNASGAVTVAVNTGPAFSAYRSGPNQSLTTATFTKVQLNAEDFDTNSNFDSTTNYRFTPTVAGYYQISGSVGLTGTNTRILCSIYKNGSAYFRGIDASVNISQVNVSGLVYFNGSTDYIELYVYGAFVGTSDIASGQIYTYLTGALVRST